jgi:hypothetical protein
MRVDGACSLYRCLFPLLCLLLLALLLLIACFCQLELSVAFIQFKSLFFLLYVCCMYVLSGVGWEGCSCFLLSCLLRLLVCSLAGCESR